MQTGIVTRPSYLQTGAISRLLESLKRVQEPEALTESSESFTPFCIALSEAAYACVW